MSMNELIYMRAKFTDWLTESIDAKGRLPEINHITKLLYKCQASHFTERNINVKVTMHRLCAATSANVYGTRGDL